MNLFLNRNVIIELLDSLPHMFKDTTRAESVYTSAVRGGLQALVRKAVENKKEIATKAFFFVERNWWSSFCFPNMSSQLWIQFIKISR